MTRRRPRRPSAAPLGECVLCALAGAITIDVTKGGGRVERLRRSGRTEEAASLDARLDHAQDLVLDLGAHGGTQQ